jgi:hypothetical protein
MFGERGYLTFPARALARKPLQGFIAWFCSCCLRKPAREETRVPPRTDENCEEDTAIDKGEKVAMQKRRLGQTSEERRCSYGKGMELQLKKRGHSSVDEQWLCNKDSHEGRKMQVRMLRKCRSSDNEGRYEDSAGGGKCAEVPMIRVHHAQVGDEHYGDEGIMLSSKICKQSHLDLITLQFCA